MGLFMLVGLGYKPCQIGMGAQRLRAIQERATLLATKIKLAAHNRVTTEDYTVRAVNQTHAKRYERLLRTY